MRGPGYRARAGRWVAGPRRGASVLPFGVSVEVHTYRLEVRGAAAGRHVLRQERDGRDVRLEAETRFDGALGRAEVTQLSRCTSDHNASVAFVERQKDPQSTRSFRIDFDDERGLVRMQREGDDSAEVPYLLPYRDPLSMLRDLRRAAPDGTRVWIPMLGKSVLARALGEVELDTALGTRRARSYLLHPGGSRVWIDVRPPHAVLRLAQATPEQTLDVLLESVGSDTRMPAWETLDAEVGRKGAKKRRRRRRRGRGGRRGRSGG